MDFGPGPLVRVSVCPREISNADSILQGTVAVRLLDIDDNG